MITKWVCVLVLLVHVLPGDAVTTPPPPSNPILRLLRGFFGRSDVKQESVGETQVQEPSRKTLTSTLSPWISDEHYDALVNGRTHSEGGEANFTSDASSPYAPLKWPPSFDEYLTDNNSTRKSRPPLFPDRTHGTIEARRNAFYINDKPTLLIGGSLQWFRMVPEVWEDRIKRLKGMGMNVIDMYVAWRNHEPAPGQFDFKTYDIVRFLELCKKHRVFVYLRPGPYITNELDGGGVPAWVFAMSTKSIINEHKSDGLINLRTQDADNLAVTKRYFFALNRVIKPYLITNGGTIILYAIENEYNWFEQAFDVDKMSDYPREGIAERPENQTLDVKKYLSALRDFVRNDGIDVPITTCPGDSKLSFMGDVKGIIPMPNIYMGFKHEEHLYYKLLRKMHDPTKHKGIYRNYPTGISETGVHTQHLRKAIIAGSDAVFLFNAIGFAQPDHQNCLLLNGRAFDITATNLLTAFNRLTDFSRLEYIRQAFVSPEVGYFPGVYDYESAVSPSGIHREKYFNIRRIALFYKAFGHLIAAVERPMRTVVKPDRYSKKQQRMFGLNFDVLPKTSRGGSDDPELGEKVYYYLRLGSLYNRTSVIIGALNDGKSDAVELGSRAFTAYGVEFPMYTELTVPVEQHSDISSEDPIAHRTYMMLLPVNLMLFPGVRIRYSTSEVLTRRKNWNGERHIAILTGQRGFEGEFSICDDMDIINSQIVVEQRSHHINRDSLLKDDSITVHDDTAEPNRCVVFSYKHLRRPQNVVFKLTNGQLVHVIVLDHFFAGRTFFAQLRHVGEVIISGADYVDEEDGHVMELNGPAGELFVYSIRQFEFGQKGRIIELRRPFNSFLVGTFKYCLPLAETVLPKINLNRVYARDEVLPPPPSKENLREENVEAESQQSSNRGPMQSTKWLKLGDTPEILEKHGVYTGHAYYSAFVTLTKDQAMNPGSFYIPHASDFISIYINRRYVITLAPMGTEISNTSPDPRYQWSIPSRYLKPGLNEILFRVEIWGHGSFMFFRGRLKRVPMFDQKIPVPFLNLSIPTLGFDSVRGLYGDRATLGSVPMTNWHLRHGLMGDSMGLSQRFTVDHGWGLRQLPIVLKPGQALWFRSYFHFQDLPDPATWNAPLHLVLKGRSAKAKIYLNGRLICRWISDDNWLKRGTWTTPLRTLWTRADPDQCPISIEMLNKKHDNVIVIFIEDTGRADVSPIESGVLKNLYIDWPSYEPIKRGANGNRQDVLTRKVSLYDLVLT